MHIPRHSDLIKLYMQSKCAVNCLILHFQVPVVVGWFHGSWLWQLRYVGGKKKTKLIPKQAGLFPLADVTTSCRTRLTYILLFIKGTICKS